MKKLCFSLEMSWHKKKSYDIIHLSSWMTYTWSGEIPKSGWRDRSWKPGGRKRRGGSNPSFSAIYIFNIAEWSSLVARRAHNPKAVGSNPASATNWSRGVAVITSACHAEDREFDSRRDRHLFWLCSSVGRARDWKSLCRWFDSIRSHHFNVNIYHIRK